MLVQHLNSCSIAFKYGPDLPQNVEIALLTFNHKQNKTICVSVCCWCFGERPHTLLFEFYNLMRRSSTFFFLFSFQSRTAVVDFGKNLLFVNWIEWKPANRIAIFYVFQCQTNISLCVMTRQRWNDNNSNKKAIDNRQYRENPIKC